MFCSGTSPMRSGFPGGGIFGGDGSLALVQPTATAALMRMASPKRTMPERFLLGPAGRQRKPASYYTHPQTPAQNPGLSRVGSFRGKIDARVTDCAVLITARRAQNSSFGP